MMQTRTKTGVLATKRELEYEAAKRFRAAAGRMQTRSSRGGGSGGGSVADRFLAARAAAPAPARGLTPAQRQIAKNARLARMRAEYPTRDAYEEPAAPAAYTDYWAGTGYAYGGGDEPFSAGAGTDESKEEAGGRRYRRRKSSSRSRKSSRKSSSRRRPT